MAQLTFIPNTSASSRNQLIPLESITDEVKEDMEQVYEALKTNPGRMRVAFPSAGELNAYVAQATAYCKQRPAGEIRFRKSPTKNLPPNTMEFRVTDLQTDDEKVTEEIRNAVEEVKTTAKK